MVVKRRLESPGDSQNMVRESWGVVVPSCGLTLPRALCEILLESAGFEMEG